MALARWYETHLGINLAPRGPDTPAWVAKEGVMVFAPFAQDSDYFSPDRSFMLNFRVWDLDAMLAQIERVHPVESFGCGVDKGLDVFFLRDIGVHMNPFRALSLHNGQRLFAACVIEVASGDPGALLRREAMRWRDKHSATNIQ